MVDKRDAIASGESKVSYYQASLSILGYDLGNYGPEGTGEDGVLGQKTTQAIKDFQKAAGLEPTGEMNPETEFALNLAVKDGASMEEINVEGQAMGHFGSPQKQASTGASVPPGLGAPVSSREELEQLSEVDLLARTLYGEAAAQKNGVEAVAWTIRNRVDAGHYGGTYSGNVLAKNQYSGLTENEADPTKNPASWTPDTNSDHWKHCAEVANDIINNGGANTTNPIGGAMYFRSHDWLTKNNRLQTLPGGQVQLCSDGKWNLINNTHIVGGNYFFSYGSM